MATTVLELKFPKVALTTYNKKGELISETIFSDPLSAEIEAELLRVLINNMPDAMKDAAAAYVFVEDIEPMEPLTIQYTMNYQIDPPSND